MHETYRTMMRGKVEAAIAHAKSVGGVSHKATKGLMREIIVHELFRPLLPANIGIGSGQIIDSQNRISKQQDVIIFNKRVLPPVVIKNEIGLYPIESVLYTVEVKSRLSGKGILAADASARELRNFTYLPGEPVEGGGFENENLRLLSTVFAFDSDLSGKNESESGRYNRLLDGIHPALHALCVVGKGYWLRRNNEWHLPPGRENLYEVLGFIAGILKRYRVVSSSRGFPLIENYFFENG